MKSYNGMYKDVLFEGRWKVVGVYKDKSLKLQNIYNGETMRIAANIVTRFANGTDTISKYRLRRMTERKFNTKNEHPRLQTITAKKIMDGDFMRYRLLKQK